jgi:hypothetical protein
MRSAVFADLIGRERGVKYDRELLWVSAVLHDLGQIALCQLGIAVDLGIAPPDIVSHEMANEVLAAYPWLDTHELLLTTLVGLYQKNPQAVASNAVAEACERRVPGFQRPNLCDRLIDRSAHGVGTRKRTF